jgi:mono/diheme cytochrome c family protein
MENPSYPGGTNCMKMLRMVAVALASTLVVPVAFGQKGSKKAKKVTAKAGDVAKGKELFEGKCIVCHNTDSNEKKIGPGLKGIKDGKLPSGKNATREAMLENINTGGGGMPAYKELLTEEEKTDIIAYVLTL